MEERTLQRAVGPFFTTKATGQGAGLGLSMVHGLAAQPGGDLLLDSALGEGTTATLQLPVSNEEPIDDPSDAASNEPNASADGATVLLVDDEALVRMGTAAMLADAGYEVIEAASATEALASVESGLQFNALVTDFAMPGMNGAQLAQTIRKLRPSIPVLMITGFANLSDSDTGGIPRLSKPFLEFKDALAPGEGIGLSIVKRLFAQRARLESGRRRARHCGAERGALRRGSQEVR